MMMIQTILDSISLGNWDSLRQIHQMEQAKKEFKIMVGIIKMMMKMFTEE